MNNLLPKAHPADTQGDSFPQSRNRNLTTQEIGDELMIYDLEINRGFCLNQTAALVWQYSDGHNSVGAIAAKLSEILHEPVSEEMIRLALDGLHKENLLVAESVSELSAKGVSRRKLLREAALTSAVALPVISAIAAPTSVQAQSCVPFGGSCRTTFDCCPPPQGVSQVLCDNDPNTPASTFRCVEFAATR